MLVLTRKKGESIVIGEGIEVFVADISPTQVRIGIKAPSNLEIMRKEIYLAIKEENRRAGSSQASPGIIDGSLKALLDQEKERT